MSFPEDPRDLKVWFGFGYSTADDPTAVDWEQISPNPDDPNDPGPVEDIIRITRGRVGNAPTTDATRIEFGVRNADGEFSPRNVTGPRYGTLRKGTPTQVTVDIGSGDVILGTAFVPEFSPQRDGPGINPRVPINALGILSTIGRDQKALSAMHRSVLSAANNSPPLAYWPLEGSLAGGTDDTPAGVVEAGSIESVDVLSGSTGEIMLGSASAVKCIATATGGSTIRLESAVTAPGGATTMVIAFCLNQDGSPSPGGLMKFGNTVGQYWFSWTATDVTFSYVDGGTVLGETDPASIPGDWRNMLLIAQQSGGDTNLFVRQNGVQILAYTATGVTLGTFTGLIQASPQVSATEFDIAHLAVYHTVGFDSDAYPDVVASNAGYAGDQVHERFNRNLDEAGVAHETATGPSVAMGYQPVGTLLGHLREGESADHGVLVERRNGLPAYDTVDSRYNATVALTLAYGTPADPGNVSDLLMYDDDRDVANLVTVTRSADGFFATAEEPNGPVGTGTAEGIGERPFPATLNLSASSVSDDRQVKHHAGWIRSIGTVDKPRYEVLLNPFAVEEIRADLLAMGDGARIQIPDAPVEDHGPNGLDLIVEGEVIEIGAKLWTWRLYCEPYEPYAVQVWAEESGLDSSPYMGRWAEEIGTCLDEAIDEDDVAFDVDVADGAWTQDPGEFDTDLGPPLLIDVGGEHMQVTDINESGGTWTFTVVRSVNGVVKSHADGTPLSVYRPLIWAL